jgi:hypothetical protein
MAAQLGDQLGQRIIIDGRPGAGGTLAMEIAANATPDGYTIFMGQPVITISPNFKRKLPIDPLTAFAPVSVIGLGASMMMVNPSTPVSNVKELVAHRPLQVVHQYPGGAWQTDAGFDCVLIITMQAPYQVSCAPAPAIPDKPV